MTGLKTFCDTDGNTVGYAISAITSSIDPDTCVPSFGLQAEYYDTDFNVVGSSLPDGWGECCCGGSETVTTLTKDAVGKTATYTNEIGATTVLSETDFTANSQVIPGTCEGVLADANVLRELPVRWDAASNMYKAYDDGKTHSLVFEGPWNGTGFPSQTWNTGDSGSTPVAVMVINNPSACKPLNLHKYVTISANLVTNDNVNVPTIRWDGYFDNGTGVYFIDAQPRQSAVSNASGQIFYNSFGAAHRAPPSTIPPGGSHTYRSYITGTYEQGNSAGRISTFSSGYGLLNGIGVSG